MQMTYWPVSFDWQTCMKIQYEKISKMYSYLILQFVKLKIWMKNDNKMCNFYLFFWTFACFCMLIKLQYFNGSLCISDYHKIQHGLAWVVTDNFVWFLLLFLPKSWEKHLGKIFKIHPQVSPDIWTPTWTNIKNWHGIKNSCIGPHSSGGLAPWCLGGLFIFAKYTLHLRIQQKRHINFIVNKERSRQN